jgi:hypothetical protein
MKGGDGPAALTIFELLVKLAPGLDNGLVALL